MQAVFKRGEMEQLGCCFFPSTWLQPCPWPLHPLISWGQLSAAVISALCSPGLSLPGRPDADHACTASFNYSTAEHGRQQGRRQLLQRSLRAPRPNPTWTKSSPCLSPNGDVQPRCEERSHQQGMQALAHQRLSRTSIPTQLHSDAQQLCLTLWSTNLWEAVKRD